MVPKWYRGPKGYTLSLYQKSLSASSYRGEILGTILTQLILCAAVQGCMGLYPVIIEDYDNDGVVKHGNALLRILSSTKTQSEVLGGMIKYITKQPFRLKFMYFAPHCDDTKPWSECTLKERMIVKVNSLAKLALMCAHAMNEYFDGRFPDEDFRIFVADKKVTGPIRPALEEYWGQEAARHFLDKKRIVSSSEFDCVWWKGMRMAMDSYPKMFGMFIAKQVSGWCCSNSKQSLWDTSINNICPNCGMLNETSKHMTQCKDPGRLALLQESIDNVLTHLEKANAPIPLIEMI